MATSHPRTGTHPHTPPRTPDLVRWGPVVAGAAIGLAVFALLSTLWLAVAAGPGDDVVQTNLAWFMGPSAAFALLLAGVVAGLFAGARGALAGLANGITAWGLLFVLSLTAIVPGAANLTAGLGAGLGEGGARAGGALGGVTAAAALWAGFWSLLAGLVLAALGGLLGGRARRPVPSTDQRDPDPTTDPGSTTREGPATATDPHATAVAPVVAAPQPHDGGAHEGRAHAETDGLADRR